MPSKLVYSYQLFVGMQSMIMIGLLTTIHEHVVNAHELSLSIGYQEPD